MQLIQHIRISLSLSYIHMIRRMDLPNSVNSVKHLRDFDAESGFHAATVNHFVRTFYSNTLVQPICLSQCTLLSLTMCPERNTVYTAKLPLSCRYPAFVEYSGTLKFLRLVSSNAALPDQFMFSIHLYVPRIGTTRYWKEKNIFISNNTYFILCHQCYWTITTIINDNYQRYWGLQPSRTTTTSLSLIQPNNLLKVFTATVQSLSQKTRANCMHAFK